MTKVKGRLTQWIEAKVRALGAPVAPASIVPHPIVAPVVGPAIEKAPPHVRVAERGARAGDRHTNARRPFDGCGHRPTRRR